jgi:hypothetical protein
MKLAPLVDRVFSALTNRALRAEADRDTAIELLKNADREVVRLKERLTYASAENYRRPIF